MSVKEPQSAQVPGKENEAGLLGRAACLRKGKSLARVDATQPHGKLLEAGFLKLCSTHHSAEPLGFSRKTHGWFRF